MSRAPSTTTPACGTCARASACTSCPATEARCRPRSSTTRVGGEGREGMQALKLQRLRAAKWVECEVQLSSRALARALACSRLGPSRPCRHAGGQRLHRLHLAPVGRAQRALPVREAGATARRHREGGKQDRAACTADTSWPRAAAQTGTRPHGSRLPSPLSGPCRCSLVRATRTRCLTWPSTPRAPSSYRPRRTARRGAQQPWRLPAQASSPGRVSSSVPAPPQLPVSETLAAPPSPPAGCTTRLRACASTAWWGTRARSQRWPSTRRWAAGAQAGEDGLGGTLLMSAGTVQGRAREGAGRCQGTASW